MVFLRWTKPRRCLLLSAMLALLLLSSSFWLHTPLQNVIRAHLRHSDRPLYAAQGGVRDCGDALQPCLSVYHQTHEPFSSEWAETERALPLQECPGHSFQAWRLLQYLKSSLKDGDDVLLEPYLQSWDQLLNFMESLGPMVSFFSLKVKEKIVLIQELSIKGSTGAHGKHSPSDQSGLQTPGSFGLKNGAYRSVQSMVKAELKAGVVDFTSRTDSGCRTLLRLHRSLLWLKLMLEGLAEGPDADGRYKTPGELCRDAYRAALAPHHPWVLRQAAEWVFLALPDRQYFLNLVCVQSQEEATPVLNIIINALTLVHAQTQRILAEHEMLELP